MGFIINANMGSCTHKSMPFKVVCVQRDEGEPIWETFRFLRDFLTLEEAKIYYEVARLHVPEDDLVFILHDILREFP